MWYEEIDSFPVMMYKLGSLNDSFVSEANLSDGHYLYIHVFT